MNENSLVFLKLLSNANYKYINVEKLRILYTEYFEYKYTVSKDNRHWKGIGFMNSILDFELGNGKHKIEELIRN